MTSAAVYTTDFDVLHDTDSVAEATRRMVAHRVSDLPVVDADARLVGMFKLDRLLALLLPKAALLGLPDLTFLSDTIEALRERMREIEHRPVRDFAVRPEAHLVPSTTPAEMVLLLHRGANNLPVVDPETGRLVGMVSAREVLTALIGAGA